MIEIISFGYKHNDLDGPHVFDCRHIRNPFNVPYLHGKNGLDEEVSDYVTQDPYAIELIQRAVQYGKDITDGVIAFGCMGGIHRSVAIAEEVAWQLEDLGYQVTTLHESLESQ